MTKFNKYFDINVAKDYVVIQDGNPIKKTQWQRVGRAWSAKSGQALNVELFMLPNHRYVIPLVDKTKEEISADGMEVK